MADWVHAVERAYVAVATGGAAPPTNIGHGDRARAYAALGAVASHYLAVGTPRTLGLVADPAAPATIDAAALSVVAHRTWFAPREIRCAELQGLADTAGGTVVTLAEALACDIVCVHAPIALHAAQLRRGTHVNVLAAATLDADLRALATIAHEVPDLGKLAAGLVDGRQLDELTVFIAGDAALALAALAPPGA